MSDSPPQEFTCTQCEADVGETDSFCRNCGALFGDGWLCTQHPSSPAEGVCVICSKPFCKKCGKRTNGVFLCDPHWGYEIQEGMAGVFGTMDNLEAQRVTAFLNQAGFHPFLYSRVFNPRADLVAVVKIVRGYGPGNHPIPEQRVFVPFGEVLKAEETLRELGLPEE
jgi:hypothetical protein